MSKKKSVLFVGQAYYNAWFLSRSLRKLGWKADLMNIDSNPANQNYYWGEDFILPADVKSRIELYIQCLNQYDVFHFSNRGGIYFVSYRLTEKNSFKMLIRFSFFVFLWLLCRFIFRYNLNLIKSAFCRLGLAVYTPDFKFTLTETEFNNFLFKYTRGFPVQWDIYLLKALGKKIVYSNNGCNDGVTPSTFSKWGPHDVCRTVCAWYGTSVCTDKDAKTWGRFRNFIADFQVLSGGNRGDYNRTKKAHEVPEFYCLDQKFWNVDLEIPQKYELKIPRDVIRIYHSVGNYKNRTKGGVNIKSSHIYFPLIEELRAEGYKVELVFCHDIPSKDVRYVMSQCDIVVDMLTFGWFGANIREAMMLGIPTICFIRPEWLKDVEKEIPDYARELPVISANPDTIKQVLIKMIEDVNWRRDIGARSRDFAVKWHSSEVAGEKFNKIYTKLLSE